jgi:hypothetical protein
MIAFKSKSQQTELNVKMPAKDYLKKSKKQRNTGFIVLGSGVAMFTGGCIAMQHTQSKGEHEFRFVIGGLAAALTSIPFFISAGVNKHKANISMKREAFMITPYQQSNISYASIGFRLDL